MPWYVCISDTTQHKHIVACELFALAEAVEEMACVWVWPSELQDNFANM